MSETLRIESNSSWDAVALTHRIAPYHWYLVQPRSDRWWVCLEFEEAQTSISDDLLTRVQDWLHDRDLPEAVLHMSDRDYTITAQRA